MRNKAVIIVLFLLSVSVPLHFSSAIVAPLGGTGIGTQYNPIYIQEVKDPRLGNAQKESNLKNTYGISNYSSCYSASNSSCGNADTSDPYVQSGCLAAVQYCLESRSISQSYAQKWDQDCKQRYGVYSKLDSVDQVGKKYNCGCLAGYEWSVDRKYCQAVQEQKNSGTLCNGKYWDGCPAGQNFVCPSSGNAYCEAPKTSDQICQGSYPNSTWDGTKNNAGGLNCDCKDGYQWNQGKTFCVALPKVETVVATPITKKVPEIKSPNETKENIQNDKTRSEPIPEPLDKKATTSIRTIKQGGFWSKVRGWFGF